MKKSANGARSASELVPFDEEKEEKELQRVIMGKIYAFINEKSEIVSTLLTEKDFLKKGTTGRSRNASQQPNQNSNKKLKSV